MVTSRTIEKRIGLARNRRYARQMRNVPTEAEKRFWFRVRDRKLNGHKFRRQHTIGNYIVDFVCVEKLLIVELDGSQHERRERYDHERDAHLDGLGYRIMRFWNSDVIANIEGVLETVHLALD
jgi:very-short-patch-repair endonuclease